MNDKTRTVLAELRRGLEQLYGNRLVDLVLFGSQARGDARPDSDIDVLVVLRGAVDPFEEIERGSRVSAAVSLANDVSISSIYMSEDRYQAEAGPLILNVRAEGVSA